MGLDGGIVIANPIPEAYQMDYEEISKRSTTIQEAEEKGIHGKESTPFLLARVKDITGGESLESNIQLVYNNANVAARLAIELVRLSR